MEVHDRPSHTAWHLKKKNHDTGNHDNHNLLSFRVNSVRFTFLSFIFNMYIDIQFL